MKPRIYCFGHGWAIEYPALWNGLPVTSVQYMGRFGECIEKLDEITPDLMKMAWRDTCAIERLGFQEIGNA